MAVLIWTAKINRRRIGLVLGAAVILCAAVATVLLRSGSAQAASVVSPKGIKTAEDRVNYLAAWGWAVPDDPMTVEELSLPREFGAEYDQYLALQSQQGFDLTKYAGKRIKRYTYQVLNYPGGVQAHAQLLMYRNTVIGGEVLGEGFLHGLAVPQ